MMPHLDFWVNFPALASEGLSISKTYCHVTYYERQNGRAWVPPGAGGNMEAGGATQPRGANDGSLNFLGGFTTYGAKSGSGDNSPQEAVDLTAHVDQPANRDSFNTF